MQELQGANRFAQTSSREQYATLCYDMANVLSILQLRLYMIHQTRIIDDDAISVFKQCLDQLGVLFDCWKRLEAADH